MSSENITTFLDKASCFCLNEDIKHSHKNLFMGDSTLPLKSDCDEQLLIHLAFQSTVKLAYIDIGLPSDDSCPKTIKLFVNKNNMSFSDASGFFDHISFIIFNNS